jgi:hypothetical protein
MFFMAPVMGNLDADKLRSLIKDLRGEDHRLFRWDAHEDTAAAQKDKCGDDFVKALEMISSFHSSSGEASDADLLFGLATEYATFCITDNPSNRGLMHAHPGIYSAIVRLASLKTVALPDDPHAHVEEEPHPPAYTHGYYTPTMAAHLIYIATYADPENHQGFIQAGAVAALASAIKQKPSIEVQVMWAGTALQNLAASFCDTVDGTCMWEWAHGNKTPTSLDEFVLRVHENSLPIKSDGAVARQQILDDPELLKELQSWVCHGPVPYGQDHEDTESTYPWPTEHASAWRKETRHEQVVSIVPWAAAAALKNAALQSSTHHKTIGSAMEEIFPCLCRMTKSPDWLESSKSDGAFENARVDGSPCWWFPQDEEDEDSPATRLCMDHPFLDDKGKACSKFEKADFDHVDCDVKNVAGISPREACCACGGGTWEPPHSDEYEPGEEEL